MLYQLDNLNNLQVLIHLLYLYKYRLVKVLDCYFQLSNNFLLDMLLNLMIGLPH